MLQSALGIKLGWQMSSHRLKVMSGLGGLPLAIKAGTRSTNVIGVEVHESKVALGLSLFVLQVPGVTILILLLTISVKWTDFTGIMTSVGFSFWDIFGMVCMYLGAGTSSPKGQ